MPYRRLVFGLVFLGAIACTNPLAPTSRSLSPTHPNPQPGVVDWTP